LTVASFARKSGRLVRLEGKRSGEPFRILSMNSEDSAPKPQENGHHTEIETVRLEDSSSNGNLSATTNHAVSSPESEPPKSTSCDLGFVSGEVATRAGQVKKEPPREPDYEWGRVLGEGTFGQVLIR